MSSPATKKRLSTEDLVLLQQLGQISGVEVKDRECKFSITIPGPGGEVIDCALTIQLAGKYLAIQSQNRFDLKPEHEVFRSIVERAAQGEALSEMLEDLIDSCSAEMEQNDAENKSASEEVFEAAEIINYHILKAYEIHCKVSGVSARKPTLASVMIFLAHCQALVAGNHLDQTKKAK